LGFLEISVKVVRHRNWDFCCGGLWKKEGTIAIQSITPVNSGERTVLPSISPQDLGIFRDAVGADFTAFVDSIVRASAAKLGIPATNVHTNCKITRPDGGVDTQVQSGGADPDQRLSSPTLWQYKARSFADVAKGLSGEIEGTSKDYARQLIREGYAYRLCICDSESPEAKLKLEEGLNKLVREINPAAPEAQVLLSSDLAAWANHYPSVVAKIRGIPVDAFRFFDSWEAASAGETPTFVPTESFAPLKASVESYLDWSRKPIETPRVFGDAGVGKTRSVLEILKSQPNQRELVLYTADEQSAIRIATVLPNDRTLNAILVADECLTRARFRLGEILGGEYEHVRFITIDNAPERTRTLAPELQVQRMTEEETLKVLDANFDDVSSDRRRRYASIAKGFLRFAIHMCEHDSEIRQSGSLSATLRDAQSYYEYIFSGPFEFGPQDREALEIVSLLERVGYRDEVTNELDQLCGLVNRSPQEVRERLERIRSTGLLASGGRFFYVTPTLIAIIGFEAAWNRWIKPDPERFLRALPENMVESFQRRVSSASAEVGAVVAQFFRDWTLAKGPAVFESEPDTRRLVALVAAAPKIQVPISRSLVESTTSQQLRAGEDRDIAFFSGAGPRRLLVSLTEELAQFSDYFSDAEAILFRLSLEENEPSIGNNATNTWKGLFRIFLSGTEVAFDKRSELLRKRFASANPLERKLVVLAAAASVDQNAYKLVGPPLFGQLVPPPDWRPETAQDYFAAIRSSVDLLRDGTLDPDSEVSDAANNALLDATAHLLWAGVLEPVRESLEGKIPSEMRPQLAALVREAYSRFTSNDQPVGNSAIKSSLESWLASLKSQTLHEKLVEDIGAEPWSHHFEEANWQKRIDDLAQELRKYQEALADELPWLNSSSAKAAAELGHLIGRYDASDLLLLEPITDAAIKYKSDAFARGYFFGVTESSSGDFAPLNRVLDRMAAVDARLAYFVMLPAGDAVHSFDRATAMFTEGKIPARLLANFNVWVGNRKTTPAEASTVVRLLLPGVSDDRAAGDTAIDSVAYQLNRVTTHEQAAVLVQMFGESLDDLWVLLEAVAKVPGREAFWFVRVLRAAAAFNVHRALQIASSMMVSDDFRFAQEGEKVFDELAQRDPSEAMQAIGRYMTDPEGRKKFFFRKFNAFVNLPYETVTSWLKQAGVDGARAIARHLQPPYLDENNRPLVPPLTEFVLTTFGDDDRTFREFVAGVHSLQGFVGNVSAVYERQSVVARAFIANPTRRVREWAQIELRFAEANAKQERIEEEELGFG
jgi:hypothetical protein